METLNMKNMIVIRNLPSNMIEEAFVIMKPNMKIKQNKVAKKMDDKNKKSLIKDEKDYIIKEAELLLEDYAKNMEKDTNGIYAQSNLNKKYRRLKKITTLLAFTSTILLMMLLF